MSTIIDFESARKKLRAQDEASDLSAKLADIATAKYFAVSSAKDIVAALEEIGVEVDANPLAVLEIRVLIDTIEALVYRAIGEKHPFHSVSEGLYAHEDVDYSKLLGEFLEDLYVDDDEDV